MCVVSSALAQDEVWDLPSYVVVMQKWFGPKAGHQTLHIGFLVNDQHDTQFFPMYLFSFLTLCVFRAHRAHHQERQIVSIQPLVAVTLCRWLCCVQVGCSLPTCT